MHSKSGLCSTLVAHFGSVQPHLKCPVAMWVVITAVGSIVPEYKSKTNFAFSLQDLITFLYRPACRIIFIILKKK